MEAYRREAAPRRSTDMQKAAVDQGPNLSVPEAAPPIPVDVLKRVLLDDYRWTRAQIVDLVKQVRRRQAALLKGGER